MSRDLTPIDKASPFPKREPPPSPSPASDSAASGRHHQERLIELLTRQLELATEQIDAILYHSSDAIVLMDTEGIIQQTNPAFCRMFACDPNTYLSRPVSDLAYPDHASLVREIVQIAVEERDAAQEEVLAQAGDRSFYVDFGVSIFSQKRGGDLFALIGRFRDITEQKQVEAALHSALNREKELTEMKSRFISTASHEFRTPLAIIQASVEALEAYIDRMDENQKAKRFSKIKDQVQRITMLLDQALTVEQLETGAIQLRPSTIDLVTLFGEIVEDMQRQETRHRIIFSPPDTPVRILADRELIRETTSVLLSNAIKYSPEGGDVRFDLSCDDKEVVFSVSDRGIGIPEQDQVPLFRTFHRGSNVGAIAGTGFGLIIAKRAVALHNGAITFKSAVNEGTTFTVTIPRN